MATVDRFGIHWFCEAHWVLVSYVLKLVAECSRKHEGCFRNHKAEVDEYERLMNTIKFEDKYWDLCDMHLGIHDEVIGIDLIFGDYD